MPSVAKHDSEQKRECYSSVQSWIHFSVSGYSVRIDEDLESVSEFVSAKVRGWLEVGRNIVQNRWE